MLKKTHTQKTTATKSNNFKKQINKNTQNKTVITITLMANFDRVNGPIDMKAWKERRFENNRFLYTFLGKTG